MWRPLWLRPNLQVVVTDRKQATSLMLLLCCPIKDACASFLIFKCQLDSKIIATCIFCMLAVFWFAVMQQTCPLLSSGCVMDETAPLCSVWGPSCNPETDKYICAQTQIHLAHWYIMCVESVATKCLPAVIVTLYVSLELTIKCTITASLLSVFMCDCALSPCSLPPVDSATHIVCQMTHSKLSFNHSLAQLSGPALLCAAKQSPLDNSFNQSFSDRSGFFFVQEGKSAECWSNVKNFLDTVDNTVTHCFSFNVYV